MTFNATGNLLGASSLAASANTTFTVDYSAKFEGEIQIAVIFGTVAATSGLQVDVFRRIGSSPVVDTEAVTSFVIPSTASTTKDKSVALPTGKYTIKLTNLDGTNGLTGVSATDATVDAIS
jgi:hypothetical protein